MTYFSDLGLAEPILRALDARGYADPTPIQRQAIPALMEGRDLLGIAQTGTGKTAAFSLPSLHRLASDPKWRNPAACRMLVLSPTRELAAQIAENMRGYARYLDLSIQCVFGGVPVGKQARMLTKGCDILVATPGRLLDLIDQRALTLRHVEIFVLDEADQMMDLGFIHPLKRIAALLPRDRQSLFFSATMPQAIAELGRQFIQDPVKVEVTPQATTAERVEQYATFVNQKEKQALLTLRLREAIASGALDRALVFTRTKHGADRVARHLVAAKIGAAAIHGNKSQGQRTAALKGFREGSVQVLVATDIAARGIDVSGVSHVFNFELPNVPEQYVHRIGRTARAGADGIAMSFVAPDEKAYLRDIEKLTRVKLGALPLPENFLTEAARLPLPSKAAIAEATGEAQPHRKPRAADRRPRDRDTARDDRPRRAERTEGERPARGPRPGERGARMNEREAHAERGARHGGREAGAGGRDMRTPGRDRPFPEDRAERGRRDDRRPAQGERRDMARPDRNNPDRNKGPHGGARADQRGPRQDRPRYDPLAVYGEPGARPARDGEVLPKRMREGARPAPHAATVTDKDERRDRGQGRPRRFGGGGGGGNPRPKGQGGGRSRAGRNG